MTRSLAPGISPSSPDLRTRVDRWPRFFVVMASVLVVLVAVGFAPSFYLRAYFEAGSAAAGAIALPTHIHAHGVVLTLWFLLFLAQTVLVASRRVRLHRLLGMVGAGLAVALFATSMLVVVRLGARAAARGITSGPVALIVAGDTGLMILFALFVAAALWFRGRRDVHSRLMLLASITIVAPAIVRLPGAEAYVPISVLLPQLVLFGALVSYDIVSRRRVHPVTVWGVATYLLVAVASTAVGFTELGRAYLRALA